jgi:ubiquitin carboxyl-terminal hydrolase L5
MDHLSADLCLENETSDAKTSTSKRRTVGKKGKKAPPRKKKSNTEYGYHFIAYVPAGGYVWELDGLQYKPRRLGKLSATVPCKYSMGLANSAHQITFPVLVIGQVWQDHRFKAECFNMKRVSSPSTF